MANPYTPPLQLRCRHFANHAHLLLDLFPDDAFGQHDWDDLEEPCDCADEEYERALPVGRGWDAGNRQDHNARIAERDRRCRNTTHIDGGEDFNLVLCCECVRRTKIKDADALYCALYEAGCLVARAMRASDAQAKVLAFALDKLDLKPAPDTERTAVHA